MRIVERVPQQMDDGAEQHRAMPLNSQLPIDRQDLRPAFLRESCQWYGRPHFGDEFGQ